MHNLDVAKRVLTSGVVAETSLGRVREAHEYVPSVLEAIVSQCAISACDPSTNN